MEEAKRRVWRINRPYINIAYEPRKEIQEQVAKLIAHPVFTERDSVTTAITENRESPLDSGGSLKWWEAKTMHEARSIYINELGVLRIDFGEKGSEIFASEVLEALRECGFSKLDVVYV